MQVKKFLSLAVSELMSFAAAVSGFINLYEYAAEILRLALFSSLLPYYFTLYKNRKKAALRKQYGFISNKIV